MSDSERRITEFEKLNLVEKAAYLGGSAFRLLASGIDFAISRTTNLVADIEKSFNEGMDPNIEDAKILEERESKPASNSKKKKSS